MSRDNQVRVRLAPRTRVLDGGRLIVGGAPMTVQRLRRPVIETDAGTELGRRWLASGLGLPVLDNEPDARLDELTVVVPAHGHPDRTARCARALLPLRVIVVDDASKPPLPQAAIRLELNLGPAGARNAGLRDVTTPYVAFVDSDVTASATDLLALTRHFADPTVALIAPRVRGEARRRGARSLRWWERYDAEHNPLDLGPHPGPVQHGAALSFVPSACLVARTAALGAGFDPTMRMGEDVDLVWRLIAEGHRVRYDPSVIVSHDTRPTARAWLRQYFDYGTGAAPLAARHSSAIAPAILPAGLGTAMVLVLARVPGSGAALALAWLVTSRRLTRVLPPPEAAHVAGLGVVSAARQEASLAVRHWWPLGLAAATHRRGRRLLASALMVDAAVALTDRRGLPPTTLLAGRRLTDLAYGAGVWVGAISARDHAALAIKWTSRPAERGSTSRTPERPPVTSGRRRDRRGISI